MQDDDPVVRENAESAFGARLVEGKAVERAVEEGGESTRDLFEAEARADFGASFSLSRARSLSLFLRLSRGVPTLTRCYRARPVRPRQPDLAPLRDRAVQHLHRLCRPRLAPPLVLVTVVGRGARGAAQAQRSVQEPGRGSARDGRERARVALGSVVGAAAGRRAGRGSRAAGRGGAAVEGQRVDSRGGNRAAPRTFSSSSLIADALRGRYILTLHMHIHARERYREALLLVTPSCASSPSS